MVSAYPLDAEPTTWSAEEGPVVPMPTLPFIMIGAVPPKLEDVSRIKLPFDTSFNSPSEVELVLRVIRPSEEIDSISGRQLDVSRSRRRRP